MSLLLWGRKYGSSKPVKYGNIVKLVYISCLGNGTMTDRSPNTSRHGLLETRTVKNEKIDALISAVVDEIDCFWTIQVMVHIKFEI